MNIRITIYFIILFGLSACVANPPRPVESEYLRTTAGGFEIEKSTHVVHYVMRFDVVKKIENPIKLKILYENPVDKNSPLISAAELVPGQTSLEIASKPLPAIQNQGIYNVTIIGVDTNGDEILRHVQSVQFVKPPGF